MKQKILVFLGMVLMVAGAIGTAPAYAAGCSDRGFLGLKPWYDGLTDASCDKVDPDTFKGDKLVPSIWRIALNVLYDIGLMVGIVALGFVVYGGYLYILSEGDPGKAAKGKKTLTSAVIGLVIAVMATLIVNFLVGILGIGG